MIQRARLFLLLVAAALSVASAARADVGVVRAQFTDRVERGAPVAAQASLGRATSLTYWVEVRNTDAPTAVTLVWRLDGREVARQTLEVGRAPRWRSWGSWRTRGARAVEVQVIDARGATLRTDQIALR